MRLLVLTLLGVLLLPVAASAQSEEITVAEIIQRGRETIATEQALEAVQTLTFRCTVYNREDQKTGEFTMYLKKPDFYKSVTRHLDSADVETIVSNGVEGYRLVVNAETSEVTGFSVLPYSMVSYLTMNATDSLYFFRTPKGNADKTGVGYKRGKPVYEVTFTHTGDHIAKRYFSQATGELLSTFVPSLDVEIEEHGEQLVQGVRFPKQLENYDSDGYYIQSIHFDSVEVNTPIDSSAFDFPQDIRAFLQR
jgi:outer membrane lipoprotein-sorting protein